MRKRFKFSLLGAAASLWLSLAGSASAGPLYQSCIWLLPDPATGQIFYNGNCDRKDHGRASKERTSRRPGPEPDPDDPCDCTEQPASRPAFAVDRKRGWSGTRHGVPMTTVTGSRFGGSFGPGRGGKRGK